MTISEYINKRSQNLKVQFLVRKCLGHLLRNFFQNRENMFFYTNWSILSNFEKIFLSKCPRLSHFSTNWTFSFWLFLFKFSASDRLQITYFDYTKWCRHVGCNIAHAGSFKNHKNTFLNDPNTQKRCFWPFSWLRCIGLT